MRRLTHNLNNLRDYRALYGEGCPNDFLKCLSDRKLKKDYFESLNNQKFQIRSRKKSELTTVSEIYKRIDGNLLNLNSGSIMIIDRLRYSLTGNSEIICLY